MASLANEDQRSGESISHEEGCLHETRKVEAVRRFHEDVVDSKEVDELESAKAEIGEVREENERLKKMLKQIETDYKSLQLRFFDILKQETLNRKSMNSTPSVNETEEPELVSLCLGRSSSESKKNEKTSNSGKITIEDEELKASLTLGVDSKFQVSNEIVSNLSPQNSIEEEKEEEAGETWPPSKNPKTMRNGDDEISPQSHAKRARVSVRARCDAPTMNDGCQWRKYGQKIAKGNPCPRAYYRCTVAPACPVRKQVQRCADDMSILITTYEGTHNHPLPISATAMASTTSAAASMLLSGSSTSQPGLNSTAAAIATTELNGLNFNLYDTSKSRPFYPQNSSYPSFPTITLDLTTPQYSSFSQFNRYPTFPSASLNFASSDSNIVPTIWGTGYHNHGALPFNQNQSGSLNLGKRSQDQLYQPQMDKNLTETLTKAISSDPTLRSVIAAAVSTMAKGTSGNHGDQVGESFRQNLGSISSNNISLTQNGKNCGSSFFSGFSSSSSQTGNLLNPSLPFSIFKNGSMTPSNKEQNS